MASPVDRQYVSRYSQATFALQVYVSGAPGAADGPVEASLYREGSDVPEWTRETVAGSGVGVYEATLSSVDTSVVSHALINFNYQVDGVDQVYGYDIEIGPHAPAYDALGPEWRDIVEGVWMNFADLFDSPYGGPNLQVYAQTHFGRNRLAQLLSGALDTLNVASSPHKTYAFNQQGFPFSSWGGLLGDALYIEVLKHLVRSYVEQPEAVLGTAVSRVDRRDYMNRWQTILDGEQREFASDLSRYKMDHMGLGNVHVLVSGGAFGNHGPTANPGGAGIAAARGYYTSRRFH